MKTNNPIRIKSYSFAISILKLYKQLKEQNEYLLGQQILKSGTSIGANVEEAIGAQSRKDFFMKMTIAYKEARESNYWLMLLREGGYLSAEKAESMLNDNQEILKLLGSIQKTIKRNQNADKL